MFKNFKKISVIPFIICAFLILFAGDLIYYSSYKNPDYKAEDLVWNGKIPIPPKYITRKQARSDIKLLLYALDHAYGGRGFIDSDIEQAKKKLQTIQFDKTITPQKLCQAIDNVLFEIPDNHLMACLKIHNSLNIKKKKSGLKPGSEKGQAGILKKKGVGNNKNTTTLPWFVQNMNHHNKNILLIAITYFPSPDSNKWKGFLAKVQAELKKADALILDVRNNRGGFSNMAEELAKILYNSDKIPDPVDCIYFKNRPETYIIHANFFKRLLQESLAQKNNDSVEFLQKQYDWLLKKAEQAKKKNSPPYDIIKRPIVPLPTDIVKKPIAILINKHCGSSGEIIVDLFEAHPYAIRIGENTKGTIHFGNIGFFILPYSKIGVRMPCQYRAYHDKRFIERKGIAPHIQVPAGTDALDVALNVLEKNNAQNT